MDSHNDPEYIIDDILPAHEIHLLGGASGSGKTTLMMQILQDLKAGRPIFGKQSHPVPFCYVACDRSLNATKRTLQRMGIAVDFPMLSIINNHNLKRNIDSVVSESLRLVPDLRYLVVDGIGSLVPEGKINDYLKVLGFMCHCSQLCEERHITIHGMGHSTKTKEGEAYQQHRGRFLGSVAWGGHSETMLFIEQANLSDASDPARRISILPRNSQCLTLDYTFDRRGKLIPISEHENELVLDVKLLNVERGVEIPSSLVFQWAGDIPRRTVERWLTEAVNQGKLQRIRKGVYQRPNLN